MYYADLTPYRHYEEFSNYELYASVYGEISPNTLNVGWLDAAHPFPRWNPPDEFLDRLFELCLEPVRQTRGFHSCQFCWKTGFGLPVARNGRENTLGSAEISVLGREGKVYAAPNLIYHYVAKHKYRPPEEFIEAVWPVSSSNPRQSNRHSTSFMKALWLRWRHSRCQQVALSFLIAAQQRHAADRA